jgi:hypothetical protein
MDVAVECPECGEDSMVSSVCDTTTCKCGASIDVQSNRTARLKLKGPNAAAAPAAPAPTPEASSEEEPANAAANIMAVAQNKEPDAQEITQDDLSGRHKSKQEEKEEFARAEKIRNGKEFRSRLIGFLVTFALIGGGGGYFGYWSLDSANEKAQIWFLISIQTLVGFAGLGLLLASFKEGMKEFLIIICLPLLAIGIGMANPLLGALLIGAAFLYQLYFIVLVMNSAVYKGLVLGNCTALAIYIFRSSPQSVVQELKLPPAAQQWIQQFFQ